jgi:proteic killer suppression protein
MVEQDDLVRLAIAVEQHLASGSAVWVPAVGPSALSDRYGTACATRSYVTRASATGLRAQYRASRVAKARSSSATHTAVCTWHPECGHVSMPAACSRVRADICRRAVQKLDLINEAGRLDDLRFPPGNRLHQLHGDRDGQWSISVNDQWRICFRWSEGDAYDVEFCDYH